MKLKPRLFSATSLVCSQASAKCVSKHFETLCKEFKRNGVLTAVCGRLILLYNKVATMNAVLRTRSVIAAVREPTSNVNGNCVVA